MYHLNGQYFRPRGSGGLASVGSVALPAVGLGVLIIVGVRKERFVVIVGDVHFRGTSGTLAVCRGTVGHGRSDAPLVIACVTAGSSAEFMARMGKLEMPCFLSGGEFVVLSGGVVFAFNVGTAVNFDLRRNTVRAGAAGATSTCAGGVGATPTASAPDRRHTGIAWRGDGA